MSLFSPSVSIGRSAFALRLAPCGLLALVLPVAFLIAVRYVLLSGDGRAFLAAIAALWIAAIFVAIVIAFIAHALLPRLRDIGVYGPMRTFFAFLWFTPFLPFMLVALLGLPQNFVPNEVQVAQ
jgi:hypothetical protein